MNTTSLRIIDDFMPAEAFKRLQDKIMHPEFPWFYIDQVSLPPKYNDISDPLAKETEGFNHIMYDEEFKALSFAFEYFEEFFKELEKIGYTSDKLIRARASMKLKKEGFTEANYNLPHVDYFFPHESFIFYINDSDGDTRIFNQWFTPVPGTSGIGYNSKFTVETTISPKENRLVWINGLQYHTASNPIKSSRRVIVNINTGTI
jgi:hypothetical protein